jgi:protein-S-isoprenylcysteine O-methyltransferase Ste14
MTNGLSGCPTLPPAATRYLDCERFNSNRAKIFAICYLSFGLKGLGPHFAAGINFALLILMARFESRIAIISTLSLIVQIVVILLAWGDWNSFFAHPARRELVVASVLLTVVAWFSGTSGLSSGKSSSPQSKRILLWFMVLLLTMITIPPYCDRRDLWTIDGDAMRYLGLALFWIGSVVRLIAVFALGHRFTGIVAIQPNHKLKTDGIYRHVRHPSYTGLLVAMIGWVLVFRSSIGLGLNLILFLLLLSRMADEETFLEAEFGDEYCAYRKKSWRLLPFVY